MPVDCTADEVRQIVARVFAQRGLRETKSASIEERIRIDAGRYQARTYRLQGWMAMWLVPAGIVQFYDRQGQMCETVDLRSAAQTQTGQRLRSAA